MKNDTKYKIFLWLYRVFTYLVPSGGALYFFLIDTLINKELTWVDKLSAGAVFVFAIMVLIAIFFYGKHLKKQISKLTDEIIVTTDDNKKAELITKKAKIEGRQEIFHNACFVAPFVILWVVIVLIEKKIISLRGFLMVVAVSMCSGLGFDCVAVKIKQKGVTDEVNGQNEKKQ